MVQLVLSVMSLHINVFFLAGLETIYRIRQGVSIHNVPCHKCGMGGH